MSAVQYDLDGTVQPVSGRNQLDWYKTPRWLAEAGAAIAPPDRLCTVLDLGCGDGALGNAVMARAQAAGMSCPKVYGFELDDDRADRAEATYYRVARGNVLARPTGLWIPKFRTILTNPPFAHWDEFVRLALALAVPGVTTVMVLGFVNVLGGQARAPWWRDNPPTRIHLSPRRASFTADGQTDPRDVCWIEWSPGPRDAQFRWLDTER